MKKIINFAIFNQTILKELYFKKGNQMKENIDKKTLKTFSTVIILKKSREKINFIENNNFTLSLIFFLSFFMLSSSLLGVLAKANSNPTKLEHFTYSFGHIGHIFLLATFYSIIISSIFSLFLHTKKTKIRQLNLEILINIKNKTGLDLTHFYKNDSICIEKEILKILDNIKNDIVEDYKALTLSLQEINKKNRLYLKYKDLILELTEKATKIKTAHEKEDKYIDEKLNYLQNKTSIKTKKEQTVVFEK